MVLRTVSFAIYDPNSAAQFTTYAAKRIHGAVLDGVERLSDRQQQISERQRRIKDRSSLASDHFHESSAAVNVFDQLAEIAVGLALGYLQLGETAAIHRMAVHGHPSALLRCICLTQLLQNAIDGAEASYRKANELDRTFGETQGAMAIIAHLRGDQTTAKRLMERAKRLNPVGMTLQYLKLLQLQEDGDQSKIQHYLQDALKRSPSFRGDSVLDMIQRMGRVKGNGGK